MPVQSIISTFLVKELSGLEIQFPGDCIDNVVKNADKWTFEKVANQQTLGNAGGSAGSRNPDHLIKSPLPPVISVTYLKNPCGHLRTNCGQIADK